MERHFIRGIERWSEEIALEGGTDLVDENAKYTAPLLRRLVGMVLGGRDAIPSLGSKSHRRDCSQLKKHFLPMGAYLLDHLATKAHADGVRGVYEAKSVLEAQDAFAAAFLASDTYIPGVRYLLTARTAV
jgi:hypothetical protein